MDKKKEIFKKIHLDYGIYNFPFELINPANHLDTLDEYFFPKSSNHLLPFCKHNSGSYICFWNKNQKPVGNRIEKIVWLDSEGQPTVFLAKNLDAFFYIIPFGIEFLYEIMWAWNSFYENPQKKKLPSCISKLVDKEREILGLGFPEWHQNYFSKNQNHFDYRKFYPIHQIESINNDNADFHEWVKKGYSNW